MAKQKLIDRIIKALERLPEDNIGEVADFVFKKYEEQILQKGIETMTSESDSFAFLREEENLYDR